MNDGLKIWLNGDLSMDRLLQFAQSLAASKAVRLDRLAKRTKEGPICWFCENAPEVACGWRAPPPVNWPTLRAEAPSDGSERAHAEAGPPPPFPRSVENLVN
jgi:hypothetical protein